MKLSTEWLNDYVPVSDVDALAKKLTHAGLEIEGVTKLGQGLTNVVVAQIQASVQHPNADKLSVTTIDAGVGTPLQVVCGAKNYQVGDKVPLAMVGASLPGGLKIKEAKLRGVESFGMLCSAKELGLAEDASGLLILDPGLKPGTPIAEALGLKGAVFEVNVTPNRADALSHLGIARDVAALTGATVKPPEAKLNESGTPAGDLVRIRIEDPERCPRYAARVITGVRIGPSPDWMKRRLEACGVRAINNVVDVTNYVLLEYGHPLHGFDLDQVAGSEIVVRRAKAGEKLTTLDGKERALDQDDLCICDRDRPQALAGVMGGGHSEVTEKTSRILLESAYFQPGSIRRSAKRHGLHTEASHRFERGADVQAVTSALDRAAALIAELGGGQVARGRVDVFPTQPSPRKVTLRYARVGEVLGLAVEPTECRRILKALGFGAEEETPSSLVVLVPTFRPDVDREEDLIEEIARIRGFDAIPEVLPGAPATLPPEPASFEVERRIRQALSATGLSEVVNYSFVAPEKETWVHPGPIGELGKTAGFLSLQNPLSVEQSVMRQSLLGGLLQNLSSNLRHGAERVRLYELGRGYFPRPKLESDLQPVAHEQSYVSGVVYGSRGLRTWADKDARAEFHDAKGSVEALLESLRIGVTFVQAERAPFHPRATAAVMVGDVVVGYVGELHPKVARVFDVPDSVFAFELHLDQLEAHARLVPAYAALGKYPAVHRDLAVLVPLALTHSEVRRVILEVGTPLVTDARVFDVYTGKPIPEGQKNLAFAIRYQSKDRTLTDAEVAEAHGKIVEEVNRRLGASLR